jgi:hypothetical protein
MYNGIYLNLEQEDDNLKIYFAFTNIYLNFLLPIFYILLVRYIKKTLESTCTNLSTHKLGTAILSLFNKIRWTNFKILTVWHAKIILLCTHVN